VVILYAIIKYGKKPAGDEKETAMDILEKRYARGEIDAEEFSRKKKDLES
jgi:uncharacterized membrane protein